jgi:hypothetical protein
VGRGRRGRGRRERRVAHMGEKNEETPWTTMEGSSPKKTEFAGAEKKIIDWRHTDSWIDESKALGRSSRRDEHSGTLGFHPELRRAIPGIVDRNWRKDFKIWKGFDERVPTIYILLGFEDILFFVIIPFLELK